MTSKRDQLRRIILLYPVILSKNRTASAERQYLTLLPLSPSAVTDGQ